MSRYLIMPSPAQSESGLILHLDAGNTASYSGSGSTWFDISGRGLNAVLTSTSYTSDAGGGIVFGSGSVGSVPAGLNFSRGGFSISVWLKHTGVVSTARVQRYFTLVSSPLEGPVLRHNTSSASSLHGYLFDSTSTFRSIDVTNQVFTNTYYNFVYTYGSSSGFNLYRNSSLVGSLATTVTLPTPNNIAIIGEATTEFFEGNIYVVQYYNREMIQAEITEKFNALRGRFGI